MLLVKSSVLNFNRERKFMEFNDKLLVGTKIIVGDINILEQQINIYIREIYLKTNSVLS